MYQLLSLGVWLQESHNLILQAGGGTPPMCPDHLHPIGVQTVQGHRSPGTYFLRP